MKRTALTRRTPLVNKTPLRRRTELRRTSSTGSGASGGSTPAGGERPNLPRYAAPARGPASKSRRRIPVDVAAVVAARSGGRCEAQLRGCWGEASERHHRISQKAGGRHGAARARADRASNLLHLCLLCHHVITATPRWSRSCGWQLTERREPTAELVMYRGRGWVYLDDAGGVHDYETAGA